MLLLRYAVARGAARPAAAATYARRVWRRRSWDQARRYATDVRDLAAVPLSRTRNFCIVAHVDHGKSTLADRLLEAAGAVGAGQTQMLDTLQVEKERGITVKAQTASILHTYKGETYLLNLIDTPGHVDFSYEVSRSLAACQGTVLLVDANKGVQAQTVANFYLAYAEELAVVPVLNKVDLPGADPEATREQLMTAFDIDPETVLEISAKLGRGIGAVLDAVVERVPPPLHCRRDAPFRALLYDCWFHTVRGAVCMVAVVDGRVKAGSVIAAASTGKQYTVKEVGHHLPAMTAAKQLSAGQVGFLTANIKTVSETVVGDTLRDAKAKVEPVRSFRAARPMVFAGVYPTVQSDAPALATAVSKLLLNDSSVSASKEFSAALGQGWRLGFLGLLHLDVFLQRLQQEHAAPTVTTTPSVPYQVVLGSARAIKEHRTDVLTITNPLLWPDPQTIKETREPYVYATIITPTDYTEAICSLCDARRGVQHSVAQLDAGRVMLHFTFPLAEVVVDFYDRLKSVSSGYATFDYEEQDYKTSQLHQLTVLANGQPVDELTTIVHKSRAREVGRHIVTVLKDSLPRHIFKVALQAVVGGKVVAREDVKATRKDVTAKCYGGDITRKMKLLKNQAEGKERMRQVGNVNIPRKVFVDVLKR